MNVVITGGAGTVGTAITDHLAEEHTITSVDVEAHSDPDVESVVADLRETDLRPHLEDKDALIHLAHVPQEHGNPGDTEITPFEAHRENLALHADAVGAAAEAGVDSIVYASSNHAVGRYEDDHAPEIYYPEYGLTVDHTVAPRPDSMYGVEKVYGEGCCRLAAEAHDVRAYALRICAVRDREYDHPYGDAERGVDRGKFDRGGDAYDEQVARLKAMWQSRRDLAKQVECCLSDDTVEYDVFYGVSDNDRRWFDIDHAREVLGYEPADDGEEWDAPPE
ncbi:NAD(P)-dependent oxidoreductase [Saliphagus sp. LR7]|uniref:NAD-dependent epimerase/dehydratase family protein n=1 Tax=Saliphagus sp. LR7 TaxID=2282654 RepID=UPI000DF81451|nr:NAD(P)-dependent oxidoreductase [Saliphagus sp. LR7]